MKARLPKEYQNRGAGNMNNMIKQAQKMQQEMMKAQSEVEEMEIEASAGGGAVEVTVNGSHEILSIKMKPEVVDPEDTDMLEDLLIAALNESIRKANDAMEQGIERAKGGLSIPGLF